MNTCDFKGHHWKRQKVTDLSIPFPPLPEINPNLTPLLTFSSPSSRSTMFPAKLLVLMVLLLPQASSGRQGFATEPDGSVPSLSPLSPTPLEPSLAQTIQNLLLSRLGLQSHPNPRPGAPIPQYILDLYRFHSQQYHLVQDPDFSYPSQHVQEANTVRSFHQTGNITHVVWAHIPKASEISLAFKFIMNKVIWTDPGSALLI